MERAVPDLEARAAEFRKSEVQNCEELKRVYDESNLGREGSSISKEAFTKAFQQGKLRAYMSCLGLRLHNADELFELCKGDVHDVGLTQEDAIFGALRLKGQASNMDVLSMRRDMFIVSETQRHMQMLLQDIASRVGSNREATQSREVRMEGV